MIREELLELCDAVTTKMLGECFLELVDVVFLVCNLTQEAGLETILSAAFFLKHAANVKKSYSSRKAALDHHAYQLALRGTPAARCVPRDI